MVHTLLKLGPRGWWDLLEAQFWVLRAQRLLRRGPVGSLVHRGVQATGTGASPGTAVTPGAAGPGPGLQSRAEAIALAVERISRVGLARPLCLGRSLALHHMLERRGISGSVVRVGVKGGGGELEAHAWVEWHGQVLGDRPENTGTFLPMDTLVVEPGGISRNGGSGDPGMRMADR